MHEQPASSSVPSGRFVRQDQIAESRLAVTYRARDLETGETVVLTEVRPDQAADRSFVHRFTRETHLRASIHHPNVQRLIASGSGDRTPFFAMEDRPGRTLDQLLDDAGPIEQVEAVRIARSILAGLAAIHAAGLLHLRLTPAVVHVGDDGVVQIGGFGITALRDQEPGDIESIRALAPEQIDGGDVSEATDLYAVGVLLFTLLTGRSLFPQTNPALIRFAHLHAPPPVPSEIAASHISRSLDAVVRRALAKVPAERCATATEMIEALNAPGILSFGGDAVTLAVFPALNYTPMPKRAPISPHARRRRSGIATWVWPMVVASLISAMLIGVVVASLSGADKPVQREAVAGVSLDPDSPETDDAALTPTPRQLRPAGAKEGVATKAAKKTRTPAPTRTPRPTRTPTPDE